jgi:hypothetical protein
MNYNKGKFDQLSELLIKEIKKEEVAKWRLKILVQV